MTDPAPFISVRPRLEVAGQARTDLDDAVLEAVVQLPLAGQAHAELRLGNWGAPDSGNREPDYRFDDLALGDTLSISLGENAQGAVFNGEITAIEERYGDGAPQLVLLAEDALHHLARVRHSREFEDTALQQLVQDLADEAGLDSDVQIGEASGRWLQMNESNLGFLLRNQGYADLPAAGRFYAQAWRFLHGHVVCSDTPGLRSGREVDLSGVSTRLAGTWRVVDCRHHFDAGSGLYTHLELNRPDWEPR